MKSEGFLLTKKDLCTKVLNCDVKTAEKYFINQEGFPFVWVGERKRYPLKEVEHWLKQRTIYK